MSEKEWDIVQEVHVKGAYACSKAVWPVFRKQKFGRIINVRSPRSSLPSSVLCLRSLDFETRRRGSLQRSIIDDVPRFLQQTASAAGIYGNFGQVSLTSPSLPSRPLSSTGSWNRSLARIENTKNRRH